VGELGEGVKGVTETEGFWRGVEGMSERGEEEREKREEDMINTDLYTHLR
jgi:hypothetical protein